MCSTYGTTRDPVCRQTVCLTDVCASGMHFWGLRSVDEVCSSSLIQLLLRFRYSRACSESLFSWFLLCSIENSQTSRVDRVLQFASAVFSTSLDVSSSAGGPVWEVAEPVGSKPGCGSLSEGQPGVLHAVSDPSSP